MNAKNIIANATNEALSVTPSVMVTARLAKVSPADFAVALADSKANSAYVAKVASNLIQVRTKEACEQEEKANA